MVRHAEVLHLKEANRVLEEATKAANCGWAGEEVLVMGRNELLRSEGQVQWARWAWIPRGEQ
eukprot:5019265-Pyramimonas_sp.AAC.2